MKKNLILLCLCMCTLLFCSCGEYCRWNRHFELIGEWESFDEILKNSRLTFYKDGTCLLENVPIKQREDESEHYTLRCIGNKESIEKIESLDKWNFHGYWKVEEIIYSGYFSWEPNHYDYRILISPHPELLGPEQERDSLINCTNADDAFYLSIKANTATIIPPARLVFLYFEGCYFENILVYDKKIARINNISRRLKNKKFGDE